MLLPRKIPSKLPPGPGPICDREGRWEKDSLKDWSGLKRKDKKMRETTSCTMHSVLLWC